MFDSSSLLASSLKSFTLSNVLCIFSIKHNIISIFKFNKQNNTSIELFPYFFYVKDLSTGWCFFEAQIRTMCTSGLPNLLVNLRPWWVWWSLQICGIITLSKSISPFFIKPPHLFPIGHMLFKLWSIS